MLLDLSVMPWVFLALSLVGAVFTLNAFVPVRAVPALFFPSWLGSWLTTELAIQHVVWQGLLTAVLVAFGGLAAWPGWVGLGITVVSWLGLFVIFRNGKKATTTFNDALEGVAPSVGGDPVPTRQVWLPFLNRRRGIMTTRDIVYRRVAGRSLKLDVVQPKSGGTKRPAIMQIHGGAWIVGDKREQGWPLMSHLAANGWVCFNVNYRLSPWATFPEHLIDLKYALRWIREHADEYRLDPDFIAVTGGSAGGHLTTMMALTPNEPGYQPGFEDADTSVQAAIPVYGVYDFTNRLGAYPRRFQRLLERTIMKAFLEEEPDKYRSASPIDLVHADAPPFLVIHGNRDTLAPVEDARFFVERLREVSNAPVYYAELHGAQHAFDIFCSPRTARMVEAVLRFANDAYRRASIEAERPTPVRHPRTQSSRPRTSEGRTA